MKIKDCTKDTEEMPFGESMALTTVINKYVKGLLDRELSRKVTAKYFDVTDATVRSLKGAYDIAEAQWRSMKSKETQRKEDAEKANSEREHLAFNALKEVMAGGPNRHKAMRALHTSLNVSSESFNTVFVTQPNPRSGRQQGPRIPSSERVQDVTHATQHTEPSTANTTTSNTRYQSGYSP